MTVKTSVFNNRMLDWQTVRIPTRDVTSIMTSHCFVFHDDILQRFVEGMTDVQFTICVWRAIMQDEWFCVFTQFQTFLINFVIFPEL